MCKITGKYTDQKQFTGYKFVRKIKGKYYSPVTGMEYKVGKIPIIEEVNHVTRHAIWVDPFRDKTIFEPLMRGKTGVLVDIDLALRYKEFKDHVILKMTVQGDLHKGIFTNSKKYPIIAGNTILKMTEITV